MLFYPERQTLYTAVEDLQLVIFLYGHAFTMAFNMHLSSLRNAYIRNLWKDDVHPHYDMRIYVEFTASLIPLNVDYGGGQLELNLGRLPTSVDDFLVKLGKLFRISKLQTVLLINNNGMAIAISKQMTHKLIHNAPNVFIFLHSSRVVWLDKNGWTSSMGGDCLHYSDLEQLELEKHDIRGEILRSNPVFKPPTYYRPLLKEAKVLIHDDFQIDPYENTLLDEYYGDVGPRRIKYSVLWPLSIKDVEVDELKEKEKFYTWILREWNKHGKPAGLPLSLYLFFGLAMRDILPDNFGITVGEPMTLEQAADQTREVMKSLEMFGEHIGVDVYPEIYTVLDPIDPERPFLIEEIRPQFTRILRNCKVARFRAADIQLQDKGENTNKNKYFTGKANHETNMVILPSMAYVGMKPK
ncbi:hypothetical protein OROMI_002382 [Orobanche minor]